MNQGWPSLRGLRFSAGRWTPLGQQHNLELSAAAVLLLLSPPLPALIPSEQPDQAQADQHEEQEAGKGKAEQGGGRHKVGGRLQLLLLAIAGAGGQRNAQEGGSGQGRG
jgi:hypothetical protein